MQLQSEIEHSNQSITLRPSSQVVVAMLEPLNEGGQVSAAAASVVQSVVEAGRQHFKDSLTSLPPLPPSIPALHRCNAILAEERGTITAEEHITAGLDSLRHHSLAVRANALQASHGAPIVHGLICIPSHPAAV